MPKLIKKAPKPVIDSKKEQLIDELIEVMNTLGLKVRIEKGTFRGGYCMLREEKLFLLNRNLEQDKKINILARNIAKAGAEGIYLKPGIRELIESVDDEGSDS